MIRSIAAGIGAVAAFLAVLLLVDLPLLVAAVAGLAVYLGLLLIIGRAPGPTESLPQVPGLTHAEALHVIRVSRGKAQRLQSLARAVEDRAVAAEVRDIADQARLISEELQHDPKDIRVARRFLDYYLDATLMVVERYVDLSKRAADNADAQRVLSSFDGVLDKILETFRKQHDKLLADDVLDLDTEVEVLERMMTMEGL